MTLEELRALRDEKQAALKRRDIHGKNCQIIVGMGTCGIAAGAKLTLDAILDELEKEGIGNTVVTQTGCMGRCDAEPVVEVMVPDMEDTVYGKVDRDLAVRIVREHIVGRKVIADHVIELPEEDSQD